MRGVLFPVCEGHWEEQSGKWLSSLSAVSTLTASVTADCCGAERDTFLCAINTPPLSRAAAGAPAHFTGINKLQPQVKFWRGKKKLVWDIMEPLLLFGILQMQVCKYSCFQN